MAESDSERPDRISLEVFQHDWIPGFAAFHDDGDLCETAKAHVVLNLGTLLAVVESGELPPQDLPYMIAESLMHEAIHALEAWAKVEFSEERVEGLLEQYRRKYRLDGETHWQYDPTMRENSDGGTAEAASELPSPSAGVGLPSANSPAPARVASSDRSVARECKYGFILTEAEYLANCCPRCRPWSTMMATVLPCGHTKAQHLYAESGELKLEPCSLTLANSPTT